MKPKLANGYLVRALGRVSSPLLAVLDSRVRQRYGQGSDCHPVMFIVGAPRTGSTLLFQLVTHALEVIYTDNLAAILHRNWLSALAMGELVPGSRVHGVFSSRHGASKGCFAPSEAGEFWYRWFPRDRHFLSRDDVDAGCRESIRSELVAAVCWLDKPLVFKNLPMGQRLQVIAAIFPDARIVWCRRDTVDTVLSILAARRSRGVLATEWWSVMPREVERMRGLPELQRVVAQVMAVEAQIEADLALFKSGNVLVIDYREASQDPAGVVARLAALCNAVWRPGVQLPVLEYRTPAADPAIRAQVEIAVASWRELYVDYR